MAPSFSVKSFVLLALMLASAAAASFMRPTASLADQRPPIELDAMIPSRFGEWREQANIPVHIVDPEQQATIDRIYSKTISRNYVNADGYRIMLVIAYGKDQSDALSLHKPEVCYPAQGFKLLDQKDHVLDLPDRSIAATRLVTNLSQRFEPVTYWTVIGDHITRGGVDKKLAEMRYGLTGTVPDGMLVRVSSIDRDSIQAHRIQADFASALVGSISPEHRARFSGSTPPLKTQP